MSVLSCEMMEWVGIKLNGHQTDLFKSLNGQREASVHETKVDLDGV